MELAELQVKLYHENCWTAELTRMFPSGETLYPISRDHIRKGTQTFAMTRASGAKVKNLIQSEKFIRFSPRIVGEIKASKSSRTFVVSFLFRESNSVYNTVSNINGTMLMGVSYFDDCEYLDFLVPSKGIRERQQIIKEKFEEVAIIEHIRKYDSPEVFKNNIDNYLRFYLSEGNYSLIHKLTNIGYFDTPKKVSIDDAATILGVSKGFISRISRRAFDIFRISK